MKRRSKTRRNVCDIW